MRKIVVTFLATFVLTLSAAIVAAGYYVGNYLVGFGLMRGSADNPQAPPRAYALLMPPGTWNYTRPDAPSEEWRLISSDGLHLTATHFRSERPRGNWAIIVHGYGCTQENSYYLASHYLAQGYDVLTPDLRSSGKSEGRFVTMGLRESGDIVGWAQEIAARNPEARIVLHGVSMGAATVMMAGASDALPVQVAAVVEDCGYTSAYDLLAYQMEISFRLPSFPGMNLLDWRCRSRAEFSLREAPCAMRACPCCSSMGQRILWCQPPWRRRFMPHVLRKRNCCSCPRPSIQLPHRRMPHAMTGRSCHFCMERCISCRGLGKAQWL